MTGEEFRTMLEAGYRGTGLGKGYFPQVSGFRVCIDRSQPDGSRIVQMQVPVEDGWQEIDGNQEYSVVAPDYLMGGGDGYKFPADRRRSRPGSELKYLVLDAIIRAQAVGTSIGESVDPDNPRIAFLAAGTTDCFQ
jgi:2',3'-cyclic-nucleotide 2'-phosphodiesterase (5'-nucleotidase family)